MSKQIKMVAQEKEEGFLSRSYSGEHRNGREFEMVALQVERHV